MVWLPVVSATVVVKEAVPPLSVPVPRGVPLSRKVTMPPGVPAPGAFAVTVAVKVTACPKTGVLRLVVGAAVVESAGFIFSASVLVLALKLLSPL